MEVVVDMMLTGAILGWITQLALLKKNWIRCLVPVLMGIVLFLLRPIALQQNNELLKKILTQSPSNEVFLTILWGGIILQLIVNGKIILSQLEYKNLNRFW